MHELRFVGPGDDGDHVRVESTDGLDQFNLVIDDGLREAMKPTSSKLNADLTVTHVSPREIQVRVRSGEDPADIAAEAGIDVARVLVFARPVLAERARITDEARRARARRSSPDGQLVVFGESVDERFAAHGLDPLTVGWDSWRREDGQWLVTASWRGGDSDRSAQWTFSLSGRSVTPLDETAADLLSDRPIRPVVRAVPDLPNLADQDTGPLPDISGIENDNQGRTRDDVYDQDAVERSIADGTADASTGRAYPLEPGPSATPAPVLTQIKTTSAPRSFEHRTQSRPTARITNSAPKLTNSAPKLAMTPVPPRPATPQPEQTPIHEAQIELFADPLPLRLAAPLANQSSPETESGDTTALPIMNAAEPNGQSLHIDESDESKAARARIPSWDDILLGVRRKRD